MENLPQKYLDAVQQPDQKVNPLFRFLGMEVVEIAPDRAVLRLPVKPELIQGAGLAAGGVLAALLDETMAHAVLGGNNPGELTTTIDMNVSFLRPVNKHATLTCEAHVTKRGKRIIFASATVRNNGHQAATATASFLMV
ncbi:PaaI family thioesterase [Pseudodesulfovibrio sp.]|nr:PaaI family thioesterase [Pseudodesulfovibrio sp.]